MLLLLYKATEVFEGMEIPSLSGKFASYRDGTWHKTHYLNNDILTPTSAIYASSNPTACELEIMVHTRGIRPEKLIFQEIFGFEQSDIEVLDLNKLPMDWKNRPNITQQLGMEWLFSNKSLILEVPSKFYKTKNYLINPLHKRASILKQNLESYETDNRLR